jgi:hypothetical protein
MTATHKFPMPTVSSDLTTSALLACHRRLMRWKNGAEKQRLGLRRGGAARVCGGFGKLFAGPKLLYPGRWG